MTKITLCNSILLLLLLKQADLMRKRKLFSFKWWFHFFLIDPCCPKHPLFYSFIFCLLVTPFCAVICTINHFDMLISTTHYCYFLCFMCTFFNHFLNHSHLWSSPSVSLSPGLSSWCCRGLWAPQTTRSTRSLHLWNPPWLPRCSPLSVPHKTRATWERERSIITVNALTCLFSEAWIFHIVCSQFGKHEDGGDVCLVSASTLQKIESLMRHFVQDWVLKLVSLLVQGLWCQWSERSVV